MAPPSCSRSNEFKPTDDELLRSFLYNKVHGKPLPNNGTILECDLFGDTNPWEIWEEFGDSHSYDGKDLYFFTKLKKKNGPKARSVRTIGLGAWEGEGKIIVAATDDKNKVLGIKKRFRFEKSGTDQDGRWIMHEYTLDSSLITDSSGSNHALCRFRKNLGYHATKSRKRSRSQQETRDNAKKRKTIVLGLAATTKSNIINNNNVSLEKDICHEPEGHLQSADNIKDIINNDNKTWLEKDICKVPKNQQENEGKTEVAENSKGNESEFEEEDGDHIMS